MVWIIAENGAKIVERLLPLHTAEQTGLLLLWILNGITTTKELELYHRPIRYVMQQVVIELFKLYAQLIQEIETHLQ